MTEPAFVSVEIDETLHPTPRPLKRGPVAVEVCGAFDVPVRAVAIQFPLRHPAIATVAVGAGTAELVRDNVARLEGNLPAELWGEVDSFVPVVCSDAFRQCTREG